MKLDSFSETLTETNRNVSQIKDELYKPDNGIYSRIKENEKRHKDVEGWLEEVENRQVKLMKNIDELSETAKINIQNITQRINPLDDDYKLRKARQPWVEKIIMAIIVIILGLIVPVAWKVLTTPHPEPKPIEQPVRVVEPRINPDGTRNVPPPVAFPVDKQQSK